MVLIVCTGVGLALIDAVKKDILKHNGVEEGFQEDFGLKVIQGDVFRTPRKSLLLGTLFGSGLHLSLAVLVVLGLNSLGLLHTQFSSLGNHFIVCFICFSATGGYFSALFLKMIGGEAWKQSILSTALFTPTYLFI